MDQVKLIIKKLRKFGFWVMAGVSLVLVLVFWKSVTGSLASSFNARKSKIESSFGEMQTLAGQADLPNSRVVFQTKEAIKKQSEKVLKAWEIFYQFQKARNKWPVFDSKFAQIFEDAGEKRYKSGRFYTIPEDARENYRDNIQEYLTGGSDSEEYLTANNLQALKVRYNIRRLKPGIALESSARGGTAPPTDPDSISLEGVRDDQMNGTIFWNNENFRLLRDRLSWRAVPTTEELVIAQEDLWIYETLLAAISEINEGRSSFDASVKEIVGIEIAQDALAAIKEAGERIVDAKDLEDFAKAMGLGAAAAAESDSTSSDSSSSTDQPVLTNAEKTLMRLYDDRYVDGNMQPQTFQQMNESPPAVEYKMLPVKINLIIKQVDIDKLLKNLANAHMPVEVRQVSINPGMGKRFSLKEDEVTVDRGRGTARKDRTTSYHRPEERQLEQTGPGGKNQKYMAALGPGDIELEIVGIVNIYNPPDITKFPSLAETHAEKEDADTDDETESEYEEPVARTTEEENEEEGEEYQDDKGDEAGDNEATEDAEDGEYEE